MLNSEYFRDVLTIHESYLDRTNLNNAYVSGMREELSFEGNQLNQINTIFTVGYVITILKRQVLH